MHTKTEIVNFALLKIGTAIISDFDENSATAKSARQVYRQSVAEVLRAHNWNFARRRERLSQTEIDKTELSKYAYVFACPPQCLFIRFVGNKDFVPSNNREFLWEVFVDNRNRKLISANSPEAFIEYTKEITDESLFESQFVEALSCLIAYKLCYAISSDRDNAGSLLQEYQFKVNEAIASNENEARNEPQQESNYVKVR